MNDPQKVGQALDKLFRTYHSFDRGDSAGEILRNRVETAKVYFEAVSSYETIDIEQAVSNFLAGSVPGHIPAYAPAAPLVGAEARRVMNLRLDAAARSRKPALPAPQIVNSPEAIERMTAKASALIASLTSVVRTEDAERDARQRDLSTRTDARFRPDMSPDAVKRRLGFRDGSREDERAA